MVSDVNTGHTNYFVWTHGETPWLSKVGTSTGQSPNSLEVIVQGQQPNKGPNLGHSVGFSYFEIFFSHHHEFIQPHNGWITNPATRWLHHTVGFFFFTTITFQDLVYGQSFTHWQNLRVSSSHGFFLFYHEPYHQQEGFSFQITPMGKITNTHSPRTGGGG